MVYSGLNVHGNLYFKKFIWSIKPMLCLIAFLISANKYDKIDD